MNPAIPSAYCLERVSKLKSMGGAGVGGEPSRAWWTICIKKILLGVWEIRCSESSQDKILEWKEMDRDRTQSSAKVLSYEFSWVMDSACTWENGQYIYQKRTIYNGKEATLSCVYSGSGIMPVPTSRLKTSQFTRCWVEDTEMWT